MSITKNFLHPEEEDIKFSLPKPATNLFLDDPLYSNLPECQKTKKRERENKTNMHIDLPETSGVLKTKSFGNTQLIQTKIRAISIPIRLNTASIHT